MKYDKKLGWLTFLLLPFVILLVLHFVIPLSFVVDSYPTLQDDLLQLTIGQKRTSIQSFTYTTMQTINRFFSILANIQKNLLSLIKNGESQAIKINQDNLKLANAFIFSTYIVSQDLRLNTTQNQSMWFATGVEQSQSLSTGQQQLLQNYKNVEPFISPLLAASGEFVHSLAFYLVSNDSEALFLEYPSRFSEKCSNLSNPVLDSIYEGTVSLSAGQVAPFLENASDGTRLLSLCTSSQLTSLTAVSCLRLNLEAVGNILMPIFSNQMSSGGLVSLLLISEGIGSSSSPLGPEIVLNFTSINDRKIFSLPQNTVFQGSSSVGSIFGSTPTTQNSQIFITQRNLSSYYTFPIFLGFNIPLRVLVKRTLQLTTSTQAIVSDVVRNLLIPILILIFLSTILSICILKYLLDGVDKELFDLDNRCQFIVKGDIFVEIPHHDGTKDIREVYDQVRIINKLHRYSTQSYFSGHFAQKVLKYNEARQFLSKLGYDLGNILQNMGEAYTYIQDWDNARSTLIESVEMILSKIQGQFGPLRQMDPLSYRKVPHKYKELNVILIRRLFKLNFFYFRYLQLKQIFLLKEHDEEDLKQFKRKQVEITKESRKYIDMLKKAFYPDYSSYSECIICFLNQCKQLANLKNIAEASQLLKRTEKIIEKYAAEYVKTTKLLKEKGSKYKFLHIKNKLTAHSRVRPQILHTFKNMFKSKIIQAQSKSPKKYAQAFKVLVEGARVGYFTAAITYLSMTEIRKIIIQLKLDVKKFESTQIFRQSIPFISLYYGQITKQMETQLLKIPTKVSPGLQREFVFIFDCGKDQLGLNSKLIKYQAERVTYIFEKLIKKTDRISIIKHGTKNGVVVDCGLNAKEYNSETLKKSLDEAILQRNLVKVKEVGMIEALCRSVWRIKNLKLEKVVIMFFKPIAEYGEELRKIKKRKTRYQKSQRKDSKTSEEETSYASVESHKDLGNCMIDLMQQQGLKNLKLVLYCSCGDSFEDFSNYFDLKNINRRIWAKNEGLNLSNNVVYIIQDRHKSDIDRILMLKTQDIADNNVFIL